MPNFFCALCLSLFLPLAASALPVEVDPVTPLTGTYAVEWNTAGNLENWIRPDKGGRVLKYDKFKQS